jgi:hypothetical protein
MLGFGGWKKFDSIDSKFFNFTRLAQPTAVLPGTWGLVDTFKLEDIVVKHCPEYEANYTKLADPKDAATFLDSLASRFGYTSLVGFWGKLADHYTSPKKEGDELIAKYNLESPFIDDYKRHVECRVNVKTGATTTKLVLDEAVPEKVIAKDLQRIYKSLVDRKGYFVKNPVLAPGVNPNPAPHPGPGPAPPAPDPANPQGVELQVGNDVYRIPLNVLAPYRVQA